MKIVFYNTQSMRLKENPQATYYYPTRMDMLDEVIEPYRDDNEFVIISRRPAVYLLDMKDGKVAKEVEDVKYILADEFDDSEKLAELIINEKPDLAVSISTPDYPYDWSYLRESVIAEKLEEAGIKTIANPVQSSIALFDKWRSQLLFRSIKANAIPGVFIDSKLYRAEKATPFIATNAYKEYVLHRIKQLNFPVIIKNTVGAGSVGVQPAQTYEQALEIIENNTDNFDLIVEELVEGEQFGAEIHQTKDGYDVLPPFKNSTNEEGIMDPKLNVKFGPILDEKYNIPELQEELKRVAESLDLKGIVNLDLIFKDGKWWIIEINPRWSGMTTITTASENRLPLQIFTDLIFGNEIDYSNPDNLSYALNFKAYDADLEEIKKLESRDHIKSMVSSGSGDDHFVEIILGGFEEPEDVLTELREIRDNYENVVSDELIKEAEKLILN